MSVVQVIPADLPDNKSVRVSQVAAWLGVGIHCIYKWAKNGRLSKLHKLGPRTQVFMVGELRDALRKLDQPEQPKGRKTK